jgi:hypothetical protein
MYGGLCSDATLQGLVQLATTMARLQIPFSLETMRNESFIPRARNNLVAGFLSRAGPTHLLFIDADIGFEVTDVLKLLCSNTDVVGGIYPKKVLPVSYVCNTVANPATDGDALLEVRNLDTGFLLLKRSVLERMVAAHPELKYRDCVGYGTACEPNMYALFDSSLDSDGNYFSEDWTFCARWRALGGLVFARTDVKLDHHGAYCFSGDLTSLKSLLIGSRASEKS